MVENENNEKNPVENKDLIIVSNEFNILPDRAQITVESYPICETKEEVLDLGEGAQVILQESRVFVRKKTHYRFTKPLDSNLLNSGDNSEG